MKSGILQLTLSQQDIYFDQIRHFDNPLYNIGGYLSLGAIAVERLSQAHEQLIRNHDSFGLAICASNDEVGQYISDERDTRLPLVDFSHSNDPGQAADHYLDKLIKQPFDLDEQPLYRACLLKLADDAYRYVVIAHHLIIDGWGFANLCHQLSDLYHQSSDTEGLMSLNWEEIVASEQRYCDSEKYQKDKAFWLAQSGLCQPPMLQNFYPHKHSSRYIQTISKTLTGQIATLAKSLAVGDAHLYMAVVCSYFSRAYGRELLRVGLPVHNRRTKAEKAVIGAFSGINPLVVDINCQHSTAELAQKVMKLQRAGLRHQRFPIGQLQREAGQNQGALYDVVFNYLLLNQQLTFGNDAANMVYLSHEHEPEPIKFNLWQHNDGSVEWQIDYHLGFFNFAEVKAIAERLTAMLEQVVRQPQMPVAQLDILTEQEKQQLFCGEIPVKSNQSLLAAFEKVAQTNPRNIAVADSKEQWDYQQLNQSANAIAMRLSSMGVSSGDRIAVSLSRDINMVAAVLAILKAGAAYVPLDPKYPKARLQYIINDSQSRFILVDSQSHSLLSQEDAQLLNIELWMTEIEPVASGPQVNIAGNDLAYLIYTSGSTGNPKAVAVAHANVTSLLQWAKATFSSDEMDYMLASTSLNFDLSVFELFAPLSAGSRIYVANDALDLIEQDIKVSFVNTVPSAAKTLLENSAIPSSAKVLCLAGEPLPQALLNSLLQHHPQLTVYNLYGPTEATVYATFARFDKPIDSTPTIGRAVNNSRLYVVDEQEQLLPPGLPGQLYITGNGVTQGYLGNEVLTAEKFIVDPFDSNNSTKVYKTGDLVRLLSDGQLAFLGRIDDQVKVRGYRVEPGEIEFHLDSFDGIDGAAVVARDGADGTQILVAFIVCQQDIDLAEVIDYLGGKVAAHMIPSHIEVLEALPLSANGKVDKKVLRQYDLQHTQTTAMPCVGATEQKLAQIWAELLGLKREQIAADQSFFAMGGHSLQAVKMRNKINNEFAARLSLNDVFHRPQINALAKLIDSGDHSGLLLPAIGKAPTGQKRWPLSYAQQSIWSAEQVMGQSGVYNMSAGFDISGPFDVTVAEQAFRALLNEHQILSCVYHSDEQGVWQHFIEQDWHIAIDDISSLAPSLKDKALQQRIEQHSLAGFDLSTDSMLKVCYVVTDHHHGVLLCNLHHIAGDGWSLEVLLNEFVDYYRQLFENGSVKVKSLPLQYQDFALWQRDLVASELLQESRSYWQQQLAEVPSVHSLKTDRPRQALSQERFNIAKSYQSRLTEQSAKVLVEQAKRAEVTPFVMLHAILALVISRNSHSNDIVIGSALGNRHDDRLSQMVGCFINPVALRVDTRQSDFAALLHHVNSVNVAAQVHQHVPFEQQLQLVDVTVTKDHAPLFQIMLTQLMDVPEQLDLGACQINRRQDSVELVKYDLNLLAKVSEQGIELQWQYDGCLFDESSVALFDAHFNQLVKAVGNDLQIPLAQLEMLSADEIQHLLYQLNQTERAIDTTSGIHQYFEKWAALNPDSPALGDGQSELSYVEVNQKANRLARLLIESGARSQDIIGICTERSNDTIIAMLATLKAGMCYLPLDPDYPKERLQFIVKDADARLVIGHQALLEGLFDGIALDTEQVRTQLELLSGDNLDLPYLASHNAYVIYTSGSTGKPKGVVCRHESVINLIEDFQQRQPLGVGDRCSLWGSTGFDVSVYEMFSALCFGAALDIVPTDVRSDDLKLFEFIAQRGITAGFIPAFALVGFERFLQQNHNCRLRRLLVGVEPIHLKLLNRITLALPALKIINAYGPSEVTVICSVYEVPTELPPTYHDNAPIGTATDNTRLYVMDEHLRLCPKGVIGELCVAGIGVANGYLNHAQLTAERFVENPYIAGEIVYRTGDLVRWDENGQLMFAGRVDDQVKIRGYRIEIGEIAAQVKIFQGVEEANVVVKGKGNGKYLVAFALVPNTADAKQAAIDIKEHLQQCLPQFMVPAQVVVLQQWPLLPNGKVDKKALAQLRIDDDQKRQAQSPGELALSAIWAELLQIEAPDIDANFFELGGNSLHLAQLVHKIDSAMGISVATKTLLEYPTIAELATQLERQSETPKLLPGMGQGNQALSVAEQRIWLVEQVHSNNNQNNITGGIKIKGQLRPELVERSINALLGKYKVLRTAFDDAQSQVRRQVIDNVCVAIERYDLKRVSDESQAELLIQQHGEKVLPLAQAPLLSAMLIELDGNVWRLQFNFHHMVFDGWSAALFMQAFFAEYDAQDQGIELVAADEHAEYDDFVVWQQQFLQSPQAQQQRAFWQQYLDCEIERLNLPATIEGAATGENSLDLSHWLDNTTCTNLEALAQNTKGSLYTLIHSALSLLLARLGNSKCVCIGSVASGRHVAGVQNIIGNFINILPNVSEIVAEQSLIDFIARQNSQLMQVQANQDLPYEQILAAADSMHPGQAPFEVLLNMLNLPDAPIAHPKFDIQSDISATVSHKFDLTFYIKRDELGASLHCHFNPERFDTQFITRFAGQLAAVLEQMISAPELPCAQVSLHLPHDKPVLSSNEVKTQWQHSVVERLAELADSQPDTVALNSVAGTLSYHQLEQASSYYAAQLIHQGVRKGDVVVILAERQPSLIVAMMAVLKCGGVFALLSPDQLPGYLDLVEVRCVVSLSEAPLTCEVAQLRVSDAFEAVEFSAVSVTADSPAYLAMTSGSEGLPKLISGSHGSLNAYVPWVSEHFGLNKDNRFAMLSGLTHDPLLRDIFIPLSLGATLFIAADGDFELSQMAQFIKANQINVINLTPSLAHYAFDDENQRLNSLSHCFFGGEPVAKDTVAHLSEIAPNANLISLYGASETGRALAYIEQLQSESAHFDAKGNALLGQGIADVSISLMNTQGQAAAIGEVAEINVIGPFLSLGYVNDVSLTDQRFQFEQGRCRYRTGDLGRMREDGQIEFVGRIDRQQKIRGFRVEPAQIERAIAAHHEVERALVRCYDHDGQALLVAFVLGANLQDEQPLMAFAKANLAPYLVPQRMVILPQLPLTKNAKLDEKALEALSFQQRSRDIIAPKTPIEAELVQIWQTLLERQDISTDDNFFDIGGHSLLATRLIARLKQRFALSLSYQAFFSQPNIQALAIQVEAIELSKQVKKSGAKKKRVSI